MKASPYSHRHRQRGRPARNESIQAPGTQVTHHCHTLKLNDFQLFQLLPGCDSPHKNPAPPSIRMRRSSRSRSAPHLTTLLPDRSFEQDANSDQYHQPLALLKPRMNELKPNEVRSEQSGLLSLPFLAFFCSPLMEDHPVKRRRIEEPAEAAQATVAGHSS